MTTIPSNPYASSSLYTAEDTLTGLAGTSGSKATGGTGISAARGDRVTLSSDVAAARTREALGLNPTGRLTLEDFETVAAEKEAMVESGITALRQELGIAEGQTITLSLDNDGAVMIGERFAGKKELEAALNGDDDFLTAFTRLSGTREVLDHLDQLQQKSTSLFDLVGSDSGLDSMLSLAAKYSTLKSSANPLATLLAVSRSEAPYSFVSGSET